MIGADSEGLMANHFLSEFPLKYVSVILEHSLSGSFK